MRNSSLPGSSSAYSVYASCVNRRVTGGVGRSEPSGFAPPGNGLFSRPRCAITSDETEGERGSHERGGSAAGRHQHGAKCNMRRIQEAFMRKTCLAGVAAVVISSSYLLLAQPPPPPAGQPAQPPPPMSFFVASAGSGKGADLGGLAGADRICQTLATAAGSTKTWHAYLSAARGQRSTGGERPRSHRRGSLA